jgi:hypothetical protein
MEVNRCECYCRRDMDVCVKDEFHCLIVTSVSALKSCAVCSPRQRHLRSEMPVTDCYHQLSVKVLRDMVTYDLTASQHDLTWPSSSTSISLIRLCAVPITAKPFSHGVVLASNHLPARAGSVTLQTSWSQIELQSPPTQGDPRGRSYRAISQS